MIFVIIVWLVVAAVLALVLDLKDSSINYDEEVEIAIVSIIKAACWPVSATMFAIICARRLVKRIKY